MCATSVSSVERLEDNAASLDSLSGGSATKLPCLAEERDNVQQDLETHFQQTTFLHNTHAFLGTKAAAFIFIFKDAQLVEISGCTFDRLVSATASFKAAQQPAKYLFWATADKI